jgi:DinB superfamily
MHPQLQAVIDQFATAEERLHRLVATVPAERFNERPAEGSWSPAECVAHLNLTSRAFIPILRNALEQARALGRPAPARYRRDLVGWLLWRMTGPRQGIKARTAASFVPDAGVPVHRLVAEFQALQREQVEIARRADGLPIDRIRTVSPFDARVRYNAWAALTILPGHQHRHLDQAERAWAAVSTPG